MKALMTALVLGLCVTGTAQADIPASAFAIDDTLYLTVLADSCNHLIADLEVEPSCQANRLTKNLALECNVQVSIMQTEMYCNDQQPVARVIAIDLREENVAPEAAVLNLSVAGGVLKVPVQKSK